MEKRRLYFHLFNDPTSKRAKRIQEVKEKEWGEHMRLLIKVNLLKKDPAYALKKYPELGELFGLKLDCVDETQVDKTQVKEKTKTRKKKSKKKRRGRKKH